MARGVYRARRVLPGEALRRHVAYFWLVQWALDAPYEQHVLTHPASHFIFEQDALSGARTSRVVGPKRRRFTRTLAGAGHVVGVALHAGTARAWLGYDVARLADQSAPLSQVFSTSVELEGAVLGARTDEAALAAVEAFLAPRLPLFDADARLAASLVERLLDDRALIRVDQVVALARRPERALQRLFHRHVGMSPKAVLRRFRLGEAADELARPAQPHRARPRARLLRPGPLQQGLPGRHWPSAVGLRRGSGLSPARWRRASTARAWSRAPTRESSLARAPLRRSLCSQRGHARCLTVGAGGSEEAVMLMSVGRAHRPQAPRPRAE